MRLGAGQRDWSPLKPGWLSVPAARRNHPWGQHTSGDTCGHYERSGPIGDVGSGRLGAARMDIALPVDPVIAIARGTRVVLVEIDSEGGALAVPGEGEGAAQDVERNLHAVAQCLKDLEDDIDLQLEILRLRGSASRTGSNGLAPGSRRICGEDTSCGFIHQLDKHGLDIALSAGRHAAERAKLAGVGRLIAMAPSLCTAAAWQLPRAGADAGYAALRLPCPDRSLPDALAHVDFYDALRCRGRSEIAALVGVAIAAAQMGIPFCLPDSAGGVAAEAAVGLNPGVRAWLG